MEQEPFPVFKPRMVCGEEVEPFCLPTKPDAVAMMVAAATNLIWFAMHEALADGRVDEARSLGGMLVDIVGRELSDEARQEAQDLVDETLDNYESSDFDPLNN